ncbi:Glutathione hydrolase-like YwrD proenzyme [Seminavis robusta]|uniref:Glutathione hydrolase-like YwrD proenzyme n=1 Tax=Seminavis robusta TaxID=568900 RepID=A0A9N8HAT3_9STRA|nr:Glutathione hydrolase-like YwrD proenzyme [Seminavis robusta]|eukprot:Sro332_g119380.1 Glutathione hydrolase-like YwrD proenzyme (576) ;mRNA; r:53743-55562
MGDWFAAAQKADAGPVVDEIPFLSRRSPVLCRNGCVASSQPLASSIGLDLLRKGANAAEAAIAVAAALSVVEPCSTGLGGDMFCLYYNSKERSVSAINGSGCSPSQLTMEVAKADCDDGKGAIDAVKFQASPHAVTVPGAARGYEDVWKRHGSGKFTLAELLEPAAVLAEEGFPVSPVTAYHWKSGMHLIKRWLDDGEVVPLLAENGPNPGDIIVNKDMARVLRDLGAKGATEGFYEGETGKAIAAAVQKHGGKLSIDDLKSHTSTFPEPVSTEYRGVRLWEVPPNGQGVAALVALTGLRHLEENNLCPELSPATVGKTADAYHALIEMSRLGFEDARAQVACPYHTKVPNEWFVDQDRIGKRAKELFNPQRAMAKGVPSPSSCTVSFQVADKDGNAISFVNSNFMGFGSGIVPRGCGFSLQNRGFGFTLDDIEHPNCLAAGKRPYHTIIPAMLTYADTNELHSTISNMGGNMQPQGHLQLTIDMVAGGMDPQQAIDNPRFCITDGTRDGKIFMEGGLDETILKELTEKGHDLKVNVVGHDRAVFGRAQIIKRDRKTGVYWAGSDGRADGCAMGY